MNREQLFTLVGGERDYQDNKPEHSREQDARMPVAAWILYIHQHLTFADTRIYEMDDAAALAEIRKITALGVACMENNETSSRPVEELVERTNNEKTGEEQGDGK